MAATVRGWRNAPLASQLPTHGIRPPGSAAGVRESRAPVKPIHTVTLAALAIATPASAQDDRSPRAGERVQTTLFGEDFELEARDRDSVDALDVGLQITPGLSEGEFLPYGALYFWRRQDDATWFRALVGGIYNEVTYAQRFDASEPWEFVLGFTNFTPPYETGEYVDGMVTDGEKLVWGWVRGAIGFGHRTRVGPGNTDNMFATDLLLEPGYLYFGRGDSTDPAMDLPDSTFELRAHLTTRYDALERNLVERAHTGVAFGADVIYGLRAGGSEGGMSTGDNGDDYLIFSGYALGAMPSPFSSSERHRVVASLHAATSDGVDRFSAPRVGGGADTRGEEFASIARPLLPGAAVEEFFPESYVIGSLSYRYELSFFAFAEAGVTVGWLDRDTMVGGSLMREEDTLTALGLGITSGFLGQSRLQIGYAYDFDVLRDGDEGGHAFTFRVTKTF